MKCVKHIVIIYRNIIQNIMALIRVFEQIQYPIYEYTLPHID